MQQNAVQVLNHEIEEPKRASDSGALMAIIERAAMSGDFDVAKLEKLLDLKERWDAKDAERQFVAAMAAFKANPPEIVKDKSVSFKTNQGVTSYKHATLGNVCSAAIEGLGAVGISHRWNVKQEGNLITVECVLTHRAGHSISTSMSGAPDNSGSKNAIQQVGSTITYLQRYTLLAATGLAAEDDDDGKGSSAPPELITESQATDLRALAEEVGADKDKFLVYMGVEQVADILATDYKKAVAALRAKGKSTK